MLWFCARLRSREDDGFTLIEAVVSLTLIAIVMSSFAAALMGSVRAGMVARQNQQAGDVLNRAVEQVRSNGFSSIAMDPADVTGTDGGLLSSCAGTSCLTVDGVAEELVLASGGAISPHQTTLTLNAATYTIRRYVSQPTDAEAGASYKRLTIYVDWTVAGASHRRLISTLLTDTRRGLPLPSYKFSPVGATSVTVNPGGSVLFGFKVTNNGARDTWNLTTDAPTAGWTWVLDDGDNTYDAATDTMALTDTNADGVIDTGAIEPTYSVLYWVLRTVPATPSGPYTDTAAFVAASSAEPSYTSTLSTVVNVQTGVVTPTPTPTSSATASPTPSPTPSTSCPSLTQASPSGVTQTALWLWNQATNVTPADSTAQSPLVLDKSTTPTATTLFDYSTDDGVGVGSIQAGRVLRPSTLSYAETDTLKVAKLRYTLTKNQTINGTATATIWVVPQSGLSTDGVNLEFVLRSNAKSGSTTVTTTRATTTFSEATWGCDTFNKMSVALPVNFTLKNNETLDLFITNTGSTDVRLGYGTTTYDANMVVPLS